VSTENVELAQRAFEHFVQTGKHHWDSIDPEVEVHDHDIPDAGTYRGHEGYVDWLADWGQAWSDFRLEPERWIDAGDKVVFVFQLTAIGKGSGAEVRRRDAMVSTIRNGKTIGVDYYNNEPQALQAAGVNA
jgi:ketosteroid isomerase-like protein